MSLSQLWHSLTFWQSFVMKRTTCWEKSFFLRLHHSLVYYMKLAGNWYAALAAWLAAALCSNMVVHILSHVMCTKPNQNPIFLLKNSFDLLLRITVLFNTNHAQCIKRTNVPTPDFVCLTDVNMYDICISHYSAFVAYRSKVIDITFGNSCNSWLYDWILN